MKQSETEYKLCKNMFKSIKHKSKKSYYSEKMIEYMQKTPIVMKELISKTRKSEPHLPGKILINEHEVSGKEEIANECNAFFTNIGTELAKKVPNVSSPFESSFLKK